jgi:hypothetical protein
MTQLLGTLLGFVTVMAGVSLIVSVLVRLLHYLSGRRGQTVVEMLASLNHAYRTQYGDLALSGDSEEMNFALDVLGDPALHTRSHLANLVGPAKAGGAVYAKARLDLARRIEFMPADLLKQIVEKQAGSGGTLPAAWYRALPPEAVQVGAFKKYVDHWFKSVESASKDAFIDDTRRLVSVVSCIAVVLFNLDGLAMLGDLYRNIELRNSVTARAGDILSLSERVLADEPAAALPSVREELLNDAMPTLMQVNGLLNEPALHFGWQEGWFIKRWCAYKNCEDDQNAVAVARPTTSAIALDAVRWIAGLLFSCVMLSLGAPFWADMLRKTLSIGGTARRPGDDAPSDPSDPTNKAPAPTPAET